jgi:hypothetical protein
MPYLNCPACRLTVYVPPAEDALDVCPRCSGRLGAVRKLFPGRFSRARARRSALDAVIRARRSRPPA